MVGRFQQALHQSAGLLKAYHGTGAEFDTFDREMLSTDKLGFFFSEDEWEASSHTPRGKSPIAAFLNIRNPGNGHGHAVPETMEAQGYDGALIIWGRPGDQMRNWVAFSPDQIRFGKALTSSVQQGPGFSYTRTAPGPAPDPADSFPASQAKKAAGEFRVAYSDDSYVVKITVSPVKKNDLFFEVFDAAGQSLGYQKTYADQLGYPYFKSTFETILAKAPR